MASKGLARWLTVYCVVATALVIEKTHAQDFQYTITNGVITITNYIGVGGNVTIPNSIDGLTVTAIGGQAFGGRASLTAVVIPDSVTNIEDGLFFGGAFAGCTALTNLVLGNEVRYIGDGAFRECSSLARVSIPDSVTTLGQYAFFSCGALSEVKFGKGVTEIGVGMFGYAFAFCTNLTSVVMPASVTNWGAWTFAYCPNLANITFENGTTTIGGDFQFCPSLTNVTLPASVTEIFIFEFADCENLVGVYCKGNAPIGGDSIFYNSSNVTVYYLPGTTGWGPTYAGRPTRLWNPRVQTGDSSFGVRQNQFGFNIAGTPDIPVVVEASPGFSSASWIPVQSCTLTNGLVYFNDPQSKNYPERFYRIRPP